MKAQAKRGNIPADLWALDMFEIRAREVNCDADAGRGGVAKVGDGSIISWLNYRMDN